MRRLILAVLLLTVLVGVQLGSREHSMMASADAQQFSPALCRFGVNDFNVQDPQNAGSGIDDVINRVDVERLRVGWYVDYTATGDQQEPENVEFVPIVRTQSGNDEDDKFTFVLRPSARELAEIARVNPGLEWIIGNEPDRPGKDAFGRNIQDNALPLQYALAFEAAHRAIKGADPSARLYAGAIVQPTPVRLKYLDLVLEAYEQQFNEPLPADGWAIHNFILNEVNCSYNPENCWGAEVPRGVDEQFGEVISPDDLDDTVDIDIFAGRIIDFREWMADNGYGGQPLLVSEYGVLFPADFGFPPSVVNKFMDETFEFMRTATDDQLGDPTDGNRLVQRWSWFSTVEDDVNEFNGFLFNKSNFTISSAGLNYASYTAGLPESRDVQVESLSFSQAGNNALDVQATFSYRGSGSTGPVEVRFFRDRPLGEQIGATQTVSFSDGDRQERASVRYTSATSEPFDLYVMIERLPGEICISGSNSQHQRAFFPTESLYLPSLLR